MKARKNPVLVSKTETKWQNFSLSSRSLRLGRKIPVLVSKHEIERKKFSCSSRSTRLKERKSRSCLEAWDRKKEILDPVSDTRLKDRYSRSRLESWNRALVGHWNMSGVSLVKMMTLGSPYELGWELQVGDDDNNEWMTLGRPVAEKSMCMGMKNISMGADIKTGKQKYANELEYGRVGGLERGGGLIIVADESMSGHLCVITSLIPAPTPPEGQNWKWQRQRQRQRHQCNH